MQSRGELRKKYWELCFEADKAWNNYQRKKTAEAFQKYMEIKNSLNESVEAILPMMMIRRKNA